MLSIKSSALTAEERESILQITATIKQLGSSLKHLAWMASQRNFILPYEGC